MESQKKKRIEFIAYSLLIVVASLPLACEYVMKGGNIALWLARIEEVADTLMTKNVCLYPSAEVMEGYVERISAVSSNFWLCIPGIFRCLGMSFITAYRLFMLLIQCVAVLSARALFRSIFSDEFTAYVGVVLYITCPYRNYICYDNGNIGAAAAWALGTLYLWGICEICKGKRNCRIILLTVLTLAGIAYADVIVFLIFLGIGLLYCFWERCVLGSVGCLGGCVIAFPAIKYVVRYLVTGNLQEYQLSVMGITQRGYTIGQLAAMFTFRENLPGIGLALFGALAVIAWMCFVKEISFRSKEWKFVWGGAIVCFAMATVYFPWDFVQRVSLVLLRCVGLIYYPNVFLGFGSFLVCIPAAYAVGKLRTWENEFVKYGIPILILIAGIGAAIWYCNTLTYMREPMFELALWGMPLGQYC